MILIKVALQPLFGAMMVNASQPSFHIHDVNVHLWKRFAILGFPLFNVKITCQRLVSVPFVSHDVSLLADVTFKERPE